MSIVSDEKLFVMSERWRVEKTDRCSTNLLSRTVFRDSDHMKGVVSVLPCVAISQRSRMMVVACA